MYTNYSMNHRKQLDSIIAHVAHTMTMSKLKRIHSASGQNRYYVAKAMVLYDNGIADDMRLSEDAQQGAYLGAYAYIDRCKDGYWTYAGLRSACLSGARKAIWDAQNESHEQYVSRHGLTVEGDAPETDDDGNAVETDVADPYSFESVVIGEAVADNIRDEIARTVANDTHYAIWSRVYVDGYSYQDVVEIYGVTPAQARQIVHRVNVKARKVAEKHR